MQIKEIVNYLNLEYPKDTACDFDQNIIGLTIGSGNFEVKKVLLALDLTMEVAKQAKEIGANLIITHHPFIFNPITKVLFDSPQGAIIKFMCDNNLSTYSMHTNLDVAIGGVNDTLATMLGIEFNHELAMKNDMLVSGKINETKLSDFVSLVKEKFMLNGVRVVGDLNKIIKTVGVVGGSGASIGGINDALRAGCDCYVTGEIHLDKAIYANQMGLCLIEVNHGVERFVLNSLKEKLEKEFKLEFVVSDIITDPLITY